MKLAIGKSLRRAEPKVGLLKYFFSFFFLSGPNLAIGVGATDGTEYSNGRERR